MKFYISLFAICIMLSFSCGGGSNPPKENPADPGIDEQASMAALCTIDEVVEGTLIQCPDGTQVLIESELMDDIKDDINIEDGASCEVVDLGDFYRIKCDDGEVQIPKPNNNSDNDGNDGSDNTGSDDGGSNDDGINDGSDGGSDGSDGLTCVKKNGKKEYQCRRCNNGTGNGSEGCNASEFGNMDE